MKYLPLDFLLTGCLSDPKPDRYYTFTCPSQPDSTTWTDTTEADHYSCTETKK